MKIEDFLKKVYQKTDLEMNNPLSVSKSVPHFYSQSINMTYFYLQQLGEKENERNLLYGNKVKYYIENYNIDIKNKSDRDSYINTDDKIHEIDKEIRKIKNILTTLDNVVKYLKDIQYNIRNIIDLEKFKKGDL